MQLLIAMVVGFGAGAGLTGFTAILCVRWLLQRLERAVDQRDSLSLQLANAVLELRTEALIEGLLEVQEPPELTEDDDDGNSDQ